MSRNYRSTKEMSKVLPGSPGALLYSIAPYDAEQAPGGYLKSVKVSIIPTAEQTNNAASYLIAASSDANPAGAGDIITAQAVPDGGGTVWLNVRRTIRSSEEEEDRTDGVVYIHGYTQGSVPSRIVCEAIGKFITLIEHP